MPGESDPTPDPTPPQSPRTKTFMQHFERKVREQTNGLNEDVQVTNEKVGQLETAQIATTSKLTRLEASIVRMDKSLAALLNRFDDFHMKHKEKHNEDEERVEDNYDDDYTADTEHDDRDTRDRHRLRHNRSGMGGHRRREVPNNTDSFSKIKFKIPPFDGKYDPDAYISWEIAIEQKFACHEFPENTRVRAATSEFSDFATV